MFTGRDRITCELDALSGKSHAHVFSGTSYVVSWIYEDEVELSPSQPLAIRNSLKSTMNESFTFY